MGWIGISALAGSASAQELAQTGRQVTLRDGSQLRGQLVEQLPGERLVLLLPDGRLKSIPWAELAAVAVTPAASPSPAPAAPAAPAPFSSCDLGIQTWVRTPRPAELFERPEDLPEGFLTTLQPAAGGPLQSLCLRRNSVYRVGNLGVTSETFKTPEAGAINLDVQPGHRGQHIAGTVLMISGGAVGAVGAVTLLVSLFGCIVGGCSNNTVLIGGLSAFGGGAFTTLLGGILYGTSGTSIKISPVYQLRTSATSPGGVKLTARGLEF